MTRFYEPDLSVDPDSPFIRDAANKLVRRSYWMDMDDRTPVLVMAGGIGSHLTNDEKRAHLADLRREHLIEKVCVQEVLPPEREVSKELTACRSSVIDGRIRADPCAVQKSVRRCRAVVGPLVHGFAPMRLSWWKKELLALLPGETARHLGLDAIDQGLSLREHLPQPRRPVLGSSQDAGPVGREYRAGDPAGVALQGAERLAVSVPQPRRFVEGSGQDTTPVG
jgi:hypothetical protein